MISLDKKTKSILNNLHRGKEFNSLVLLADEMRREMRNQPIDNKESQWEVARNALMREYKAEGIKMFLDTIKKIAENYHDEGQ